MQLSDGPEAGDSSDEDDVSAGSESMSGSDEATYGTEDGNESDHAASSDKEHEGPKGMTAFERKAQRRDAAAARDRALADEEAAAMLQTNVEEVRFPADFIGRTANQSGLLNYCC
jgi:hypothetical protein